MKKIIIFILLLTVLATGIFTSNGTSFLGLSQYANFPDKDEVVIPVLMYHHFIEEGEGDSIIVNKKEFDEQMQTLVDNGYTAVTDQEILALYKEGKALPEKPIHITIDDGYLSNYDIAYPILKEKGLKATIFTVISQVGRTPGNIPHFTWVQAKEMVDSGVINIQNHTYDLHYNEKTKDKKKSALITPKPDETDEEHYQRVLSDFLKVKTEMQKNLQAVPISISYPYGSYDKETIRAAKEAGLELAYTIKGGTNTKHSDVYTLKRINVPHGWSGNDILKAIN